MSTWLIVGIIVLVLGLIVSNIMLLKYSAKLPMKKGSTTAKDDSDAPR
ncbi:DUF2897 family protein [Alteromonas sp. ASW11-36]|uniref:DUF2897 family protein n=1 Tax=Alteromonas arenosi TaxID=3055817 RepID=A0ABT7SYA4_9ALTE|nr:DUF2897 family protein [Alteromonas sp. ASW11-36]MDM7861168.1 DUF2897 family protein [Alteromonas sp. ASW11-36]